MSTESKRRINQVIGRITKVETQSETDAGWWTDLLFAGVLTAPATAFVMAHTSLGPFAHLRVTYGPLLTMLVLGTALTLAVAYLSSGVRRSPYTIGDN